MLPQFDGFGCPVECIMKDLYKNIGGEPRNWTVANILLLCWGYGIALTPLFKPTREGWRSVKQYIRAWYKEHAPESDIPRRLYHLVGTGVSILYDFVRSIFLHTLFSFAWFLFLISGLLGDREDGQNLLGPDQFEDKWAFGQLVPLLLIILPLLAAMEAYCGKSSVKSELIVVEAKGIKLLTMDTASDERMRERSRSPNLTLAETGGSDSLGWESMGRTVSGV
jgi:hypothetical protein